MRKLSKINESLWMDSIKRANSNEIRKENILTVDDVLGYYRGETIPKITIRLENGQQIVDVEGSFCFKYKSCKNGKLPFKFGKVTGRFSCKDNGLTSLEGCPEEVGGEFSCTDNNLTSLEGCPKKLGKKSGFFCYNNILTSLEGCPEEIGDNFNCMNNNLSLLKGCPKRVDGNFVCSDNKIDNLEYCPEYVGGCFDCEKNNLTSLKGIGKVVGHIYAGELTESLWMDSIKRANSSTIRKEDYNIKYNISSLKTTICISNTYWSDDYVLIGEDYRLSIKSFKEIPECVFKGWRLPTKQDFMNIKRFGYWKSSDWSSNYIYEKPYPKNDDYVCVSTLAYYMIQEESNGDNVVYIDPFNQIFSKRIDIDKNELENEDEQTMCVIAYLVRDDEIK